MGKRKGSPKAVSEPKKSAGSISPLAAMSQRFIQRMRDSGLTVTEGTEPSDEEMKTFSVTFPPNRNPEAQIISRHKKPKRIHLRDAYLATDFVFEADGKAFTMRVGERNAEVRGLLAKHGVQGAAYITACNPASLTLGEVHNRLAMRAFRKEISCVVYEGAGQDRAAVWPPEPSLMLLGISRAHAEELGRRYGQYAIVWIDEAGTPSLVELADLDRASRYPLKNPPFKWIDLGFEWGYEWADIRVSPSQWKRIAGGGSLGLKTKAWYEGQRFTMYWNFDQGHLYVSYGDDGGTAYDGKLTGASMSLP